MRVRVKTWEGDFRQYVEVEGTFDECEAAGEWFVPKLKVRAEHAELGALVRRMDMDSTLYKGTSFLNPSHEHVDMWRYAAYGIDAIARTPEDALRGITTDCEGVPIKKETA